MKRLLVIAVLVAACGSNPPSPSGSAGPAATPGNPVASDAVQPSASAGTAFVGEFPPITMQGKGTQSVTFTIPDDAIAIAALSHPAKGTFTVTALDETGKATKTLVKTNGKYSGTVLFDLDTHSVGFRVQSKGPWKIIVLPAEAAKAWDGTKLTKGAGDAVLRLSTPAADGTALQFRATTKKPFAVRAHSPDDDVNLLAGTGPVNVSKALPPGTDLLEIVGGGPWQVALGS